MRDGLKEKNLLFYDSAPISMQTKVIIQIIEAKINILFSFTQKYQEWSNLLAKNLTPGFPNKIKPENEISKGTKES